MDDPYISIIVPCPPGKKPQAIGKLNKLNYPTDRYEIIVEKGHNPSAQRNRGIKKAKGDIIAFTDDDCSMEPNWLNSTLRYFRDPSIGVIGGPNLTPKDSSFLSHCFGLAMSSYFGAASMSTRYDKKNIKGEITEQNLIFNNLFVKNEIFKKGLFLNENMFPNEENEFLNRVSKKGYKLKYSPEVFVYHPRKDTLNGFVKQVFGYGSGRANQTKIQPDSFKLLFLLPTIFVLGLLSLPLSIIFNFDLITKVILICLGCYFLLAIGISLKMAIKERKIGIVLLMPLIFFTIHASYGMGFMLNFLNMEDIILKRRKHGVSK